MAKKNVFHPFALLNELEQSCPGIFAMYEETFSERKKDDLEFDLAHEIGEYYFPRKEYPPFMMLSRSTPELQALKDSIDKENLEISRKVDHTATLIMILGEWRKTKQVYSFSKEFYNMICDAEDFEVCSDVFETLPFPSIYFQFENDLGLAGVFVKYIHDRINNNLCFLIVNKEGLHLSINFNFSEGSGFNEYITRVIDSIDNNSLPRENMEKALRFSFQAAMYLCAKNCDIVENPEQKRIYRPTTPGSTKNRYAEVRKWDVGYRVTSDIKNQSANHKELTTDKNGVVRNRPRQHWRRAHWHTYWCGPNHSKRVLKFIPPILVNNIQDDTPNVEHPTA